VPYRYEINKNEVETITLIEKPEKILIKFKENYDWNYKIIPFTAIKTLSYSI